MLNDPFYKRRFVIGGIAVGVVLIYTVRLFALQIVSSTATAEADSNALIRQTVYPSRGLIYDRNGKLLVFNQPIYEVTLIPRELRHGFDTLAFCRTLGIDSVEFRRRMTDLSDRKKNRGYSNYTPQVFMNQLQKQDIARLQETLFMFPGVDIRKRTLRDYTYHAAAHVLGSVGEVSQRTIDRNDYYARGDYAGRDGIELTYEEDLRGEKGVEILMRDSRGRIHGSYHNGEEDRAAVAGKNLTLTLDIDLQQLAEELLQDKTGSAVAIEPRTGEILALASAPAWDPALLIGKDRSANYTRLSQDKRKPLLNRATQATYPPGSTFKTIQALVALEEGTITPATLYPCSGPQTQPIKCTHHHGSPVALEKAIEQSCNPYFWCVYRDLLQQHGYGKDNEDFRATYDEWRTRVMHFGLGQAFEDTDVGFQSAGSVPDLKYFDRIYGKTGWKAITIRSLSIGQGEILVTPLQLANQAAAIANKGYYITPHLNRSDSMATHRHETGIDSACFAAVQEGMHRVMTYGTGRYYPIEGIETAGKTGTAQNPHGKDHAIFIGFAPVDNPQIAIAVVVENAGYGATWAAPIASLMMEQYLTHEIRRQDLRKRIATTVLTP